MKIKPVGTFSKGKQGLLMKALTLLNTTVDPDEILSDHNGIFAVHLEDHILCAKGYVYGDMVSCHKRVVYAAKNEKKKVLMFIGNTDKFYEFEPDAILTDVETQENDRDGETMTNFNIRLGVRYEKSPAEQST